MTLDLPALADAAKDSWALGTGSVYELRATAARQGWAEVPMRSTDSALSVLRPQSQADAAPNSLSAGYEGLIRHRLSPRASTTRLWLGRVSARVDTA